MTSSSSEPVNDIVGNSRRAASSSSATSGLPPDRSDTRSRRLADARSPSMPSMRAASSPRSRTRQGQPLERSWRGRDRGDGAHPRVVAGHDVRLIRDDEREPLVRRDPGEERDQRPRRRVRAVQVLEHEDDRFPLAEPAQHAEDALERPGLATFRGALVARQRRPARPPRGEPPRWA